MESVIIFVIGAAGGLTVGVAVYLGLCLVAARRVSPGRVQLFHAPRRPSLVSRSTSRATTAR